MSEYMSTVFGIGKSGKEFVLGNVHAVEAWACGMEGGFVTVLGLWTGLWPPGHKGDTVVLIILWPVQHDGRRSSLATCTVTAITVDSNITADIAFSILSWCCTTPRAIQACWWTGLHRYVRH